MRQSSAILMPQAPAEPDVLTLLKVIAGVMAVVAVAATVIAAWLWPRYPYLPAIDSPPRAQRLLNEPLVHAELSDAAELHVREHGYVSISHPTLVRVPD